MEQGFRSAVFGLCKKCKSHPKSKEIQEMIHNMSIVVTKEDDGTIPRPPHGDFSYISSHNRIQFLGYLITDESVEAINKQPPFHVTPLNDEERYIIEMAHKTICAFIDVCVSDLKASYPKAYTLVNPYFEYKEPTMRTDAMALFTEEEFKSCADAFTSCSLYKKIIENDTLQVLENISQEHLQALAILIDKQLKKDYKSVSDETEEMLEKMNSDQATLPDLLMLYSVYCYALQMVLRNAVQLLFEAILGKEFVVLNNDNLIKIYNHENNHVYDTYTVLCQDVFFSTVSKSEVGSIVLFNCDMPSGAHIKEFGCVYSETISFAGAFGSSTKLSFATVDADLNPIHTVTDYAMKSKLGTMSVKCRGKS